MLCWLAVKGRGQPTRSATRKRVPATGSCRPAYIRSAAPLTTRCCLTVEPCGWMRPVLRSVALGVGIARRPPGSGPACESRRRTRHRAACGVKLKPMSRRVLLSRPVGSVKGSDDLLTERGRTHRPSTFGAFQQGPADVTFQAVNLSDER